MTLLQQFVILAFGQYMVMTKWSDNNELRINALFDNMEK